MTYSSGSFLEQRGNTVNYRLALRTDKNGKLVVGISRQGAGNAISGSGTLMTLKFSVTGNSSTAFSNYELKDSANQAISGITWHGGSITIQ